MASLDKEIEVLMLRGEKGYSSYEEAVANALFSGTLEEWIETFATPDNYFTRYELKFVTQAEYEALIQADQLRPNCYYFITDDETWETLQDVISRVGTLESSMETAQGDIDALEEDVSGLQTDVSGLSDDVTDLKGKSLSSRSLITSSTDTDYHFISNGYYDWTVGNPIVAHSEYLYVLKTAIRYKATQDGYYTNYDLTPFIFDAVDSGVNTNKSSIQYIVIPSVGLIEINVEYRSGILEVYARRINLSTFAKETFGYLEMKIKSFKAVANWK